MTILQSIKDLANINQVSLAEVERQTGLSNGSITKWGKSSPSIDKLEKVATFFNVSVDYLLNNQTKNSLAEKYGVFAFDGEPVTDEEVEFLKSVLAAKRASENK
ncbi:helix-turn-helix domain-containing protein [Vagococcus silagei]|uniref:XRE family transcriptional regulator n=1 Tax=Vagococcus silagei TaxID=2508885 RepID=A0A4S3B5L9_9ENTE|nr:helix-turn-helix transcriptional regulator [Vagococcus silagei]THB62182.1 XRE family transcriptional regulator [Vagococcus silagei]